jgi:hypothetical protein
VQHLNRAGRVEGAPVGVRLKHVWFIGSHAHRHARPHT